MIFLVISTSVLNISWLASSIFMNSKLKKGKLHAVNFLIQIPDKTLNQMSSNCEEFLASVCVRNISIYVFIYIYIYIID